MSVNCPSFGDRIEKLIRRDPARRGLLADEGQGSTLCGGHLQAAAEHLAQRAKRVVIVTGFYVPDAPQPAAETDGPPGALLLAAACRALGIESVVVTDTWCAPALHAAAAAFDDATNVVIAKKPIQEWTADFLAAEQSRGLTHLIAIERAGPGHTEESIGPAVNSLETLKLFRSLVPPDEWNCCHNMRGVNIDATTAPLHLLFEQLPRWCPQAKTIGIGDGGNEIGMGRIPWVQLAERFPSENRGMIPCRIATDWNVIAGNSNWGAWGLAALLLNYRRRSDVLDQWPQHHHFDALQSMVENGPAIDGITWERQPTVDGLPFLTYIQTWHAIVEAVM